MQIPETEIIVTKDGVELLRKTVRPGDYVIGRDAGCEVQVDVELVAPQHAHLTVNFDHALIEDLGSASGTLVNGKPVKESTRLWPNQKIRIGAATVELHRVKTVPPPDVSLAPSAAAVKRLLPEEFLREKKYDIGGVVAQGGMGAILDAQESTTERKVAMKVMLDGSSPDDLTRFVAEAKVTAQLEHPNIVPVHELSVDENDQVYYTMKFVKGITLRQVLEKMTAGDAAMHKNHPLPVLLTIFQKVCDAIAFAHSKGVIHRDLKPENIMLDDFGVVLVMDWGLAKVIGQKAEPAEDVSRSLVRTLPPEASGATMAGTVMGTPQYMSPEQARGEIEDLDVRSDIYALGAILYHILALRPPVTGKDAWAIVAEVSQGAVEPLTARKNCPIPDSVAAVVRKAMAFKRDERYAHVADLQRDIAAYQNGFATAAENAGLMKQIILLIHRHKGVFATAAVAWFIITALAVWFIVNIRASERKATHNAEVAAANEQKAIAEQQNTRRALAKAQLALAEGAFREENGPAMQAALNAVPEDLRDSNWSYLAARADTSLATINTGRVKAAEAFSVAANPVQPGIFAVYLDDGGIRMVKATGETVGKFEAGFSTKLSVSNPALAFSPDGERLAIGRRGVNVADDAGGIVIHSAHGGAKLLEIAAPPSRNLQFDHDGQRLLQVVYVPSQLKVWDAVSGQLLWETKPDNGVRAAFDPQGKFIAMYSPKDRFRILDARDGTLIREFPNITGGVAFLMMHPDGAHLFSGDTRGSICERDMLGKIMFEIHASDYQVADFAFTKDGDRFVTLANDPGGKQSLQVWRTNGGKHLQTLMGGSGEAFGCAVHPLSGELLVCGRVTKSWNLTNSPVKWTSNQGLCQDPCFWGDDDLLFAPASEIQIGLFDLSAADPSKPIWKSKPGFNVNTISVDGNLAAIGHVLPDATCEYHFLVKSGRTVDEKYDVHSGQFRANLLRLNYAGDRLAVFRDGAVVDRSGRELRRLFPEGPPLLHDAAWIGSTTRIVSLITAHRGRGVPGSEEQIILSDAETGQQVLMTTHPGAMDCVAVSPDGKTIAEAGLDKMVRLRDAETLAVKKEFRAHDDGITALAFHPTRPILATGSHDLTVKLWNLETGKQIEELRGAVANIERLSFSPSGKRLAAKTGISGTVLVWEPESLNPQ